NDAVTQEFAHVSSVRFVTAPYPHTQILLKSSLLNCYDRNVTTVNANVRPVTHADRQAQHIAGERQLGEVDRSADSLSARAIEAGFRNAESARGRDDGSL